MIEKQWLYKDRKDLISEKIIKIKKEKQNLLKLKILHQI